MNNFLFRAALLLCALQVSVCRAQQGKKYNLDEMLRDNKLSSYPNQELKALTDGSMKGVSCTGIVWLKGVDFSTGSIDVDIRGRDVFQRSFLGVAFHGIDTLSYDAIYFRPFNFQSTDSLRRKHQVQYINPPDYPWERLRKEHPLVYESSITPSVMATAWFHAHIVVDKDEITVYVNHSSTPSLKVKKLNSRNSGLIGFWSSFLPGDFANMEISPE